MINDVCGRVAYPGNGKSDEQEALCSISFTWHIRAGYGSHCFSENPGRDKSRFLPSINENMIKLTQLQPYADTFAYALPAFYVK